MSNSSGTIEIFAIELSKMLRPLQSDLVPGRAKILFAQLGIPLTSAQETGIAAPMGSIVTKTSALVDIIIQLVDAIEHDNNATSILKGLEATVKISEIINNFSILGNAVQSLGIPEVTPAVASKIPERLFNYLLFNYLNSVTGINEALELLGILERADFNEDSLDPNKPPFTINTFHFDEIGGWISNPALQLKKFYDWGNNSFDGKKIFGKVEKMLLRANLPVIYEETPPKLDLVFFEAVPKSDVIPPGLFIKIKSQLSPGLQTINLGDAKIEFQTDFQLPVNTGLSIQPKGNISFQPPAAIAVAGAFMLNFIAKKTNPPEPFILFGQTGGSRFEIGEVAIGAGARISWNGTKADGQFNIEGAINQGKVVIDTSSGDGFLSKILPNTKFEAGFDIVIGVSSDRGFYFSGSSALEIRLPAHIELGPVSIEGLTLALKLNNGEIPVSIGADIKASLGPIVAVVQNIGVTSTFSFPQGGGNLGPLKLKIGFKPPNGVGLSINAGPIKGGGFLNLDFDKGEYFGAMELSFQGIIDLKAIAIINTKMPDGTKGFALLILITAEFTPIQLGFGFTLLGVGGLLALNRSLDTNALMIGVKTGAVNSILFPQDIVANITRIISDLKTIFPIVPDHFVIAPMAKIGWGTPTLISLELGIIIDIPSPQLVIVGVLRCILPTEEAAILKLQVNFAGGIDLDKGLIWFNASLYDSRLLIFTLAGDMALRIGWGSNPMFILSVGGFHPAYKEIPPDLTNMSRLMISLLSGDNPRLSVATYFAVTSNSVQSGARVELYAEACGFNVFGFYGYDLLVQFNPFYFIADIYAGLALRSGTSEIAGIHVHCQLSGPTPWHAVGDASLKILFFKVSVGFDITWGDQSPAQPLEIEDVLKLTSDALKDKRNWKAALPANTNTSVTIKKIELPANEITMHPFAILSVSQKVVPLQIEINKFGNKKPGADTIFNITYAGGAVQEEKEEFAMANFIQMSDSEKISRKSFEKIRSGLRFGTADNSNHGFEIHKDVNYELSYVHKKKFLVIKAGIFSLFNSVFDVLLGGNAIAKSSYAVNKKIARNAPARVELKEDYFYVVDTATMEPIADGSAVSSEAEAYHLQNTLISKDYTLSGTLQVVSHFELN